MVRSIVVLSVIEAIAEDLKSQVLHQELGAGTALTEVEVATRYDVARATAKAAIERLVAEKVLVRKNHKTARVVTLGPDDARDIYLTRSYLESEALRRLAARHEVPAAARTANAEIEQAAAAGRWDTVDADLRFHTAMIDGLGSPRSSAAYGSLAFEVRLCLSQLESSHLLSPEIIAADHAQIMSDLERGDSSAAAAMLQEHLARARELLAKALGGEPGPEAFAPSSALNR